MNPITDVHVGEVDDLQARFDDLSMACAGLIINYKRNILKQLEE